MATKNYIGETIYVAAALPAANTAAGFAALTWVKAAGVQQLPQLGVTHANIDVPDLESGFTAGVKGAGSGMDSQMAFRDLGTPTMDAGQLILKNASEGADGEISVKIVRGSGANNAPVSGDPVKYAQGYAHSYQENQGNTTNHKGFVVNFKQNAQTVTATQGATT